MNELFFNGMLMGLIAGFIMGVTLCIFLAVIRDIFTKPISDEVLEATR